MAQEMDSALWADFEKELVLHQKKLETKALIQNSGKSPGGQWMRKVCEKVRISELAWEMDIIMEL